MCKNKRISKGFVFHSYNQGISKNVCVKFTLVSKSTIWNVVYVLIFPAIAGWSIFYDCESSITYPCSILQNRSTLFLVILYIFIFLVIVLQLLSTIKKESLLITVPIGIQFSSIYTYGKKTVTFIPWCAIEDIVIIEVISGQQVLFYLGLLLNDNYKDDNVNGLLVLFQNTRPRLTVLEEMYNIIQQIISPHVIS